MMRCILVTLKRVYSKIAQGEHGRGEQADRADQGEGELREVE